MTSSCGEPACHASDAFDLADRVGTFVDRAITLTPLLAKINAPSKFPHEKQVHAIDDLRLERRGGSQGRMYLDWTEIRVDAEFGTQAQQSRLGSNGRIWSPLGASDGAEQDAVSRQTALERVFRQPVAKLVDSEATEGQLLQREVMLILACHSAQHAQCFSDHFRADSVAPEHGNTRFHARRRAS